MLKIGLFYVHLRQSDQMINLNYLYFFKNSWFYDLTHKVVKLLLVTRYILCSIEY